MSKIYEYDNKLRLTVSGEMKVEYSGCGSHSFDLSVEMGLKDINNFLQQLDVKPLKAVAVFPPKPVTLRPYDAKEITLSIHEALRIVEQGISYSEWCLSQGIAPKSWRGELNR